MPRSIWNGLITFGMVSIAVKLFVATGSKDVSFHQLHAFCHSRLKQLRWCPVCDCEVAWDEIVRGYEYAKGQYVVLTDADFEKLPFSACARTSPPRTSEWWSPNRRRPLRRSPGRQRTEDSSRPCSNSFPRRRRR